MDDSKFDPSVSLESLRMSMQTFATEREWQKFHTPRNILLALVGEVGEVAEILQWKGEVAVGAPELSEAEREHLGQELSDVLLYLLRLSDVTGVDLATAALKKMELNRKKYPADKCKGRSDKYTAYVADAASASASTTAADVTAAPAAADAAPVTPPRQSKAEALSPTASLMKERSRTGQQQQQQQEQQEGGCDGAGSVSWISKPDGSPTDIVQFAMFAGTTVASMLAFAAGVALIAKRT